MAAVAARRRAPEAIASPGAERAVLGAALRDPAAAARVLHALSDRDLYDEPHRRIFRAVRALVARDGQPDPVTVADELRQSGCLQAVGGEAYLTDLVLACPTPEMALTYAREVSEAARRRRVEALGIRLAEAARDLRRDLTVALTEMQALVATEAAGAPTARPQTVMVAPPASEIEPKPIDWLWEDWLPRGMLATVAGEPKVGKSIMMRALAAAVSSGAKLPGDPRPRSPEAVLLVSLEDDAARVVRPGLEAMGADLKRVHVYAELRTREGPAPLVLPEHVPAMGELATRIQAALIVIDPLVAAESMTLDTHRQRDMRAVLEPLRRLAADTGASVVVVRHTRKSDAAEVTHRIIGSMDAVAAARTVLVVGRDPERPERRAVAVAATNLGAAPEPRSYTVEPGGRLLWDANAAPDLSPERLLGAPATAEERDALRDAEGLIEQMLAEGPVAAADFERAWRANGISDRTMDRARKKLGVRARKDGKPWMVFLPGKERPLTPEEDGGALGALDEKPTTTGEGGIAPTAPSTHGGSLGNEALECGEVVL